MAVSIPQVVTEDRASGALVVDGSLKFDSSKTQYLKRTPSSAGNRKTWTMSWWQKRSSLGARQFVFEAGDADTTTGRFMVRFSGTDESQLLITRGQAADRLTSALYRDFSGWTHYVVAVDTTASGNDKIKVYKDGTQIEIEDFSSPTNPGDSADTAVNMAAQQTIGYTHIDSGNPLNSQISQYYLIDGQALGPEYFGYTDPLTNTWRPKKFKAEGTTTVLVGTPSYPSDFTTTGNKTSDQTSLSFGSWTSGSYTGAITKIFKNSTDTTFTLNVSLVGGTTDRLLWYSDNLTDWTYVGNTNPNRYYQLSGHKYYATSEGSGSTTLHATGNGHNNFYLPMDGNSPIGQDQSGNGNDWTPVNFGGSAALDKATGALPILNTLGGTVARPGVLGSEVSKNYTTTSNTAAGSGYEFDQTSGFNPSLSFVRGATYTFDYTDSSSHPLRFSSTDPDSSVTSYTDGTNTSVSNTVKITVPHNAPDTLYYYCTSHNSMNGRISVTTDTKKADPYAWKCVLALPYCGNESDVTSSLTTNSSIMTSWDANSASFQNGGNFYGSALYMSGATDYPRINFSAGAMDFMHNSTGTGTIEFWAKPSSINTGATWAGTSGGSDEIGFGISGSGNGTEVSAFISNGTAGQGSGTTASEAPTAQGVWVHIALVKTPTQLRLYIDGVLRSTKDISSYTFNDNNSTRSFIQHGSSIQQSGTRGWNGAYMSDFRVYEGLEKYTETTVGEQAFIPASANPDILPDTPSGVGTKTQLTKITDGAVSFDGTGDYLRVEDTDMAMGTGDFTVEAFIYNNVHASYRNYIGTRETGQGDPAGWCIASNAGGDLYVYSAGLYTTLTTKMSTKKWYHVVYTRESGTHKWFVDGVLRGTETLARDYTDDLLTIGANSYAGGENCDGFISNVRVIKGSVPTEYQTSSTTAGTQVFIPPTAPLTNVTNTVLLCCQSNTSATAAAVTPVSITANGNAVATNFNPFTTNINTVRGQEGAYATLNPLDSNFGTNLQNGNLRAIGSSNWGAGHARGNIALTSGKWFWESTYSAGSSTLQFGFANTSASLSETYGTVPHNSWTYYFPSSTILCPSGGVSNYFPDGASLGDTIGCALDMDNGTWQFFKNGIGGTVYTLTATDSASTASITELYPWVGSYNGTQDINFGQKPFKFSPPDGFQPLTSSTVRPDTVIPRPDQYVGATLYTGNAGTKSIDVGHKPDFVWVKARTGSARSHFLFDSVRGVQKFLQTDGSAGESALQTNTLSSFNNDGFTTGARSGMNDDGVGYVTWTWKAGGNSNTFNVDDVGYATASAAGLDGGSITPTGASVGTKQGFSIIKWTGNRAAATVSHGLNSAVKFYFVKNLDRSSDWITWHTGLSGGGSGFIRLNTIGAQGTASTPWNSTIPTNSVFSLGADTESNGDGENMIAYLWHDVPGLQKFGSYTQNSNGVFVELGFKPALLVIKNADTQLTNSQWNVVDTQRDTYNPSLNNLAWDRSNSEPAVNAASYGVDILSNGFAIPSGNTGEAINSATPGGDTYIYAAWAEAPSFNLYGAQSNAR